MLLNQKTCIALLENAGYGSGDEKALQQYLFTIRQNSSGRWELELCFAEYVPVKLYLRRGKIREFSRLNGVEQFMKKIGVTKFTVIIDCGVNKFTIDGNYFLWVTICINSLFQFVLSWIELSLIKKILSEV